MAEAVDSDAGVSPADPDLLAAMHAFQHGDEGRFEGIYQALWRAVYIRAAKMGLAAEECEDIAQKSLIRIYVHAPKARFDSVRHLWSWVYTVATREIYKHWHRKRPELVTQERLGFLSEQPDTEEDPPAAVERVEEMKDLGDCLGGLGEQDRVHLLGPLVNGLSFRQAAEVHGLTLGQFKHRYEKALQLVRDCMKSKGHVLD
jgi:RNA polymerase sigma factor (sigma-70 family)